MNTTNLIRIGTRLKEISPYFLVELLLPGGSILALLMWLRQRNQKQLVLTEAAPVAGNGEGPFPFRCCRA